MDIQNRIEEMVNEIRNLEKEFGITFFMKEDEFPIALQVEKMLNKKVGVFSDSREVAKNLGVENKHILRKYDEHKEYFNLSNESKNGLVKNTPTFTVLEDTYTDAKGEERRCLKSDQEATELLISMFNGDRAIKCKMAYIIQFHLMAEFIKSTNQTEDFRNFVKSQYKSHTDVLKEELQLTNKDGKEYIKYANLINKKVLGTSKQTFCKEHGIEPKDFRSSLSDKINKRLIELEKRVDSWVETYSDLGLIKEEIYYKVKEHIEKYKFRDE